MVASSLPDSKASKKVTLCFLAFLSSDFMMGLPFLSMRSPLRFAPIPMTSFYNFISVLLSSWISGVALLPRSRSAGAGLASFSMVVIIDSGSQVNNLLLFLI